MNRIFFYLLFLSLSANVNGQSDQFGDETYWAGLLVENLEVVNSQDEEFSPYIWSDYLIYVGLQKKKGIFKSNLPTYFDLKASLLNPEATLPNFIFSPELNSEFHEGPISWDQDNNKIYFTSANSKDGQAIVDEFGRQLLQIYQADYAQGKWKNFAKLAFVEGTENYCHPAIFGDGKRMIFASSRAGGVGKMDLYLTELGIDKSWSEPMNMGASVNSGGNQWFPFVFGEQDLFYASDVGDGQGLDLYYVSLGAEGVSSQPIRLPSPINTSHDDFGLVISSDKTKAYLSSNRPGGKGKDDIYFINLTKEFGEQEEPVGMDSEEEKVEAGSLGAGSLEVKRTKDARTRAEVSKVESVIAEGSKVEELVAGNSKAGGSNVGSRDAKDSRAETSKAGKEIEQEKTEELMGAGKQQWHLSVLEDGRGGVVGEAELSIYVLPGQVAKNFLHQVESFSQVDLLEAMAENVSPKKEYTFDKQGKLFINMPDDSSLFLVLKKEGYLDQGRFLETKVGPTEVVFKIKKEQ